MSQYMTNNALLGKLLSEHKLADHRRTGLIGCGSLLLLPILGGLWGVIASLNSDDRDAMLGLYFSIIILAVSIVLFGLFVLAYFLSPVWLKRYGLEIYENGFALRTFSKTKTCLWSEIREVNPLLLTTAANRARVNPRDFQDHGDTKVGGIYEIYKKDGSKILVNRKYTDIEQLDERLIPFCREIPNW